MHYFRFVVIAMLLAIPEAVHAETQVFSATPSECIASQKGEMCEMTLQLSYPKLVPSEYCLALNQTKLGCWAHTALPKNLTIQFKAASQLTLLEIQSDHRHSVTLDIRYRTASSFRRRVRNPWSLF